MDLQLKGKRAFISGSTSGIGFAIAKILLEEGAEVVVNGRSEERINTAIEKLKDVVPTAIVSGIPADFSTVDSIQQLTAQLSDIDILINNVGVYTAESFFKATDENWQRQWDINVMSGVRLSRHCLPKMLKKNWGRILFISSECASLVPEDLIAYSTTKAALLAVSKGLAQLTKGTAVTVNTILPGSTRTDAAGQFLENLAQQNKATIEETERRFFEDVRTSSLLQRFATVEEVATTVAYYASPLSAATNGAAIRVDGGSMGHLL
jgi:NAD(P)-dependent dehydrogenase (short-subunit alcohol dehydrogenase family)